VNVDTPYTRMNSIPEPAVSSSLSSRPTHRNMDQQRTTHWHVHKQLASHSMACSQEQLHRSHVVGFFWLYMINSRNWIFALTWQGVCMRVYVHVLKVWATCRTWTATETRSFSSAQLTLGWDDTSGICALEAERPQYPTAKFHFKLIGSPERTP